MSSNERYRRQIIMEGIGEDGQARLRGSQVLIAGLGGLGSSVAMHLASAGVGKLVICDYDKVEMSNLNRQLLHWENDLGRIKVESAAEKLARLNPNVVVSQIPEEVSNIPGSEFEELTADCDLFIDCLDKFAARHELNNLSLEKAIPLLHAGVEGYNGQMFLSMPGVTACFRCAFPRAPEEHEVPVLGASVGAIASMQALEAIRYLLKDKSQALGTIISVNLKSHEMIRAKVTRHEDCAACKGL